MFKEVTKLQNELINQDDNTTRLSSPDTIKDIKTYLSGNKQKNATSHRTRLEFEQLDEIIRLFHDESNGILHSENNKQAKETQKNQLDESYDQFNNKIHNVRLQAVKPEITINLINDKLSSLETASKEIDKKREEIKQIVLDVNKQMDIQFEEVKRKLEAKFKELNESANQILKEKLEKFDEMQKKVLVRIQNIQKLKSVLVETFQGNTKDNDKYEANLSKLYEKKSEIHHFIQALDPFDMRVLVNQCRIRSYLNTNILEELIDKIHLVDLEIAGLKGLQDLSSPLNEKKKFEQAVDDKNMKASGSDFQKALSTKLINFQFSKIQPVSREYYRSTPSKSFKGLESLLSVRNKKNEPLINSHRNNLRTYFSLNSQSENVEKNFSGSGSFLSPSSLTPSQNASFTPRQAHTNQYLKGTDKGIDISALVEARKKASEKSLNTTPRSINERMSSAPIVKQPSSEGLQGKFVSAVKLSAITAAASKNSLLGDSLQSLRKQRETFLKSSFKNWN